MINRCAIIVRPAKPYLEWAAALDDSGIVPDPDQEPSVYLIPEIDDEDDAWILIESAYDTIFEAELWSWHTDESAFPKNRTFAMFRRWFTITISSCIHDLCEGPLLDDEI